MKIGISYYIRVLRIDAATIQIPIVVVVVVEYLIASYYNIISGKVYYYYNTYYSRSIWRL